MGSCQGSRRCSWFACCSLKSCRPCTRTWTCFIPSLHLDERATLNLAVAAVHSLLEERFLDNINHQVQAVGLVVNKETDPGALLDGDTGRVEHANVELPTHHGEIHDHRAELDVGAREEGLVVVGVKLESEGLLRVSLGRLARGLESHIVDRVESLRVDKAETNSVVLATVRVSVQLGNLLVLEGLGLEGVGDQVGVGVRDLGKLPDGLKVLKESIQNLGVLGRILVFANKALRHDRCARAGEF